MALGNIHDPLFTTRCSQQINGVFAWLGAPQGSGPPLSRWGNPAQSRVAGAWVWFSSDSGDLSTSAVTTDNSSSASGIKYGGIKQWLHFDRGKLTEEHSEKVRHRERDKMRRMGERWAESKGTVAQEAHRVQGILQELTHFCGVQFWKSQEKNVSCIKYRQLLSADTLTCLVPNLFPTTPRPGNLHT